MPIFSNFIIIIFVILISGCSGDKITPSGTEASAYPNPAPITEQAASLNDSEPYPLPTEIYLNPTPMAYPSPTIDPNYTSTAVDLIISTPTIYTVPAAGQDTGVVTGQLFDQATNLPMAKVTVYLGTILELYPEGYSYTIQERSSPHTYSDFEGKFAIGNVPPGEYVLMVWTPFGATVVIDPETEKELKILIEAGQTINLGDLSAANPTIQP